MEFLVAIGVLGLLAVLAARFGHDSRELPRSKEHEQAALGMTWAELLPPSSPAPLATAVGRPTAVLDDDRPLIVQPRQASGQVIPTTLPTGGTELSVAS